MGKSLDTVKTLAPFLKQHSRMLLLGFVFVVLQNFSYMKIPMYIRLILDEIGGQNQGHVIFNLVIMMVIYTILMTLSLFLMRKLIISVSRKIEYQLRQKIFDKLVSLDYSFYQQNETGDIVSRTTNDLNDVRSLLGPGVLYIPNAITRMLLFLPALIAISGSMMLFVGGLMMLLVLLIVILMPRLRPLFQLIQEQVAKINNRVWQTITGISTIKQYSLDVIEGERFKELNRDYIKVNMAVVRFREFLWPFFIFLFSITELMILLVGGQQVIRGEISLGELLQFTMLITYLTFPVLSLGWVSSLLQQGISALDRINFILDQPVSNKSTLKPIKKGDLDFKIKGLTFRFSGQTKDSLHDVNMSISPGQTIGITGTIGSGKTTLLNILNGLLKPDPGMVFINGIDIVNIDPESLNRRIAVVSQSPFLFSKTVAENIALGEMGTDLIRVKEATRFAGLEYDVDALQKGFEQMVGERGITLSGGQKQRMAIARALYKCATVLMLDDPLSHVDAETENRILQNLKKQDCYNTMILVTHRISALKHADAIYVLDGGAVVEKGNHTSLVRKKGLYANLVRLQQMETEI